jgi:hyperosmotically inducible protein
MQRTLKNLTLVAAMGASVFAMTGCVNTGGRTAGRYMDDRNITRKVENSLEEEQVYKFPAVKVTTYRGVTQLSGFVETEEQKRRAGEIARNVMGPAEIINNISVRPGQLTPTGRDTSTGASGTSSSSTYDRSSSQKTPIHDESSK